MIAMDWRSSGRPLSCSSQKPGPFLHHNKFPVSKITEFGRVLLSMKRENFFCK
jgi:hypothetical protein